MVLIREIKRQLCFRRIQLLSLIKNIASFFIILSVFLSCNNLVKKKTVLISPTLCVDFPCSVKARSVFAQIDRSVKLPVHYTVLFNRYGQNHNPAVYHNNKSYKIEESKFKGIVKSGSAVFNSSFSGTSQILIPKIGFNHNISELLPLSVCSLKDRGVHSRWEMVEIHSDNKTGLLSFFEI